jgi:hypothetical protein
LGDPIDIEDMTTAQRRLVETRGGAGDTRRVIEIQSDLFQKGRLANERDLTASVEGKAYDKAIAEGRAETATKESLAAGFARDEGLEKLKAYENTWPPRIIQEEIRDAAKAGKTKLQFPVGETAMKIEGLGDARNWAIRDEATPRFATPNDLKIGKEISDGLNGRWIITDVLGDGKFKAMPSEMLKPTAGLSVEELIAKNKNSPSWESFKESFDISGKVDTSNPIYKFYENCTERLIQHFT